jgi:glucose-6-phosphate 1-dehydrogenase
MSVNSNSDHLSAGSTGSPCVMVIFGASGDLTKRKLIPALINLAQEKLLSTQFAIVGFSFDQMDTNSYRAHLSEEIKKFEEQPVDQKL